MVPSFLLSILARNHPVLVRASFLSEFSGPWLVWEPGEWSPMPRSALTGKTVPAEKRPVRRASAMVATAMHLQLEEGQTHLTLGRDPTCDLHVNDATLSRVHLHLTFADGAWSVLDPGSMNGTLVNGIPLPLGVPSPLREGTEIDAGEVLFTLHSSAALFKRMHAEHDG